MSEAPAVEQWYAPLDDAIRVRLESVRRDAIVERIRAKDHTVWSNNPAEITNRLGWLTAPDDMAAEVAGLEAFAREMWSEGFTTAVLLGMGGSSLAPEVMQRMLGSAPEGLELIVLDTTSPEQILDVEQRVEPDRTLWIVSSKSGTTIETWAQMEYFWAKRPEGRQFVAITDAGSKLHRLGEERGFRRVFLNPPDVGGRYSGLTLFGLVPGALIGVEIGAQLKQAAAYSRDCWPAVVDGVRLGEAVLHGRDKATFRLEASERPFGWWVEQLLAESTGKDGTGVLPVEGEPRVEGRPAGDDRIWISARPDVPEPCIQWAGFKGFETFWHWEFVTAIVGHVLGVNPFDQQSVQEAKDATNRILGGDHVDASTPSLAQTLDLVRPGDYIALLAYLPRNHANDARLARVRHELVKRCGVATTAGFGPRYLHSTGQYHKDGPNTGVFIQVVESHARDISIPGAPYSFGELQDAQALGDLASLRGRGRRITRVSLASLEAHVADL